MEFTEHVLERYAERIQDKKGKTEIKSFVAQNRDRIKDNIQKLFDSSTFLCGQKMKDHNFAYFYVNKDGWVLIVDKDRKKIITLYKVDLNLGSEFNKIYIEKMITDIVERKTNLDNMELALIAQRENSEKAKENNLAEIKTLKEQIKWLEEQNKLSDQEISTLESHYECKRREMLNQIENFIGARVFE